MSRRPQVRIQDVQKKTTRSANRTSNQAPSPTSKTAKDVNVNVFASPWKNSDMVLVVQGTNFHVHRSVLTMQSPVFDAMLEGHFKEASQNKITLKGKTGDNMLQFLKLLYPEHMIKKPLILFSDTKVFDVLMIADEYQTEDLINQCLKKITVTRDNVFQVLRYAKKYNQSIRQNCVEYISKYVGVNVIEKELPKLDGGLDKELLFAKCRHYEQTYGIQRDYISSSESDSDSSSSSSSCALPSLTMLQKKRR